MLQDIAKVSLLYDFYGKLLTNKQKEVFCRYYEENLSLSEIAQEFEISRQGVYDTLKNGEKYLLDYEEKLQLVEKFQKKAKLLEDIEKALDKGDMKNLKIFIKELKNIEL